MSYGRHEMSKIARGRPRSVRLGEGRDGVNAARGDRRLARGEVEA